jgi:transcriptional regulator with XRE-family HTH domain
MTSTAVAMQYPATAGNYLPPASSGIAAAMALAFLVGTGGMTTIDYLQYRGERGYEFVQVQLASVPCSFRTPTENLDQIRAVFKPSISDLAALLSISRQTVYNWMAGERPSPESANRLEDIAKAADLIAAHGLSTPYLLRRRIRDGKNLMNIVHDGESAHDAAKKLVHIVEQETRQRDLLRARLASRKSPKHDDSEMGIPMLDEENGL